MKIIKIQNRRRKALFFFQMHILNTFIKINYYAQTSSEFGNVYSVIHLSKYDNIYVCVYLEK